jgi:Flp pilus assembly protein TadD
LIKDKQHLEAQAVFRKVLAVQPKNWRAHHNLARSYEKTGQKAFAKRFFQNAQRYRLEQTGMPS